MPTVQSGDWVQASPMSALPLHWALTQLPDWHSEDRPHGPPLAILPGDVDAHLLSVHCPDWQSVLSTHVPPMGRFGSHAAMAASSMVTTGVQVAGSP
jgi:hypothetical protein